VCAKCIASSNYKALIKLQSKNEPHENGLTQKLIKSLARIDQNNFYGARALSIKNTIVPSSG